MNSAQWQLRWPPYRSFQSHELWLPWPDGPHITLLFSSYCYIYVANFLWILYGPISSLGMTLRMNCQWHPQHHKQCFVISATQLRTHASCSCLRSIVKFSISLSLSLKFPPIRIRVWVEKMTVFFRRFFFSFYLFIFKKTTLIIIFSHMTRVLLLNKQVQLFDLFPIKLLRFNYQINKQTKCYNM